MDGHALEFLATILAREKLPGGAFAVLDDTDRAVLDQLLRDYHSRGATAALEREARTFLISYRELDRLRRGLNDTDRARLIEILDEDDAPTVKRPRTGPALRRGRPSRGLRRWGVAAAIAGLAAAGVAIAISVVTVGAHQSGPPASATSRALAQQVSPGFTGLQEFRQDYGPWQQVTPSDQSPRTGSPAVLLLESGNYFASGKWTVPPGARGWQQDLGGNVGSVSVHGSYAGITDADGTPYLVGINQPFVVSRNPDTILLIEPDGTVLSMSQAQATAVRHPLRG